ncbi:arginyltransferase [Leptospira weilii serovar Ranarum str. ICFT]|uniref:Aspartate/glutamate leucyltransferase n=1 Tax=Leptospira weilii serovar Ranarum str. ICFT TaxID=1218598 RepID=N1WQX2_9LEPT|nr:arginyltransferase [Leptospira weilii]EMY78233.1 arginyltransferase [Leptospira weilii serovar Ranarum str. ICFT]
MIRHKLQNLVDSLPISPEKSCSYYSDRLSRIQYFPFPEEIAKEAMQFFFDAGFRRTGNVLYRASCNGCSDCLSYRIPLDDFVPSRNRKRLLKKNADLTVRFGFPALTAEKEILYLRYQRSRYESFVIGESDRELLEGMCWNLFAYPENSLEMTLVLDEKLLGFMILDRASDSLSAVYSVYDPDYTDRSLGSFAILCSILYAKEMGMKFYHLGYFLPGHPDMDYKKYWTPGEIREPDTNHWIRFEEFQKRHTDFSW